MFVGPLYGAIGARENERGAQLVHGQRTVGRTVHNDAPEGFARAARIIHAAINRPRATERATRDVDAALEGDKDRLRCHRRRDYHRGWRVTTPSTVPVPVQLPPVTVRVLASVPEFRSIVPFPVKVALPLIVPMPASVPMLAATTVLPAASEPSTFKVPAFTLVAPV